MALRDGNRIDDCQLVSPGRATTAPLWLCTNGADVFVPEGDVPEVWESRAD